MSKCPNGCGTELGSEVIEGERCETIGDTLFHDKTDCFDALVKRVAALSAQLKTAREALRTLSGLPYAHGGGIALKALDALGTHSGSGG